MNYSTLLDRSSTTTRSRRSSTPTTRAARAAAAARADPAALGPRRGRRLRPAHDRATRYPNTPPHKVLLLEAFGDHQVTNVATAVEARTIGARLRRPALDPGRKGPWLRPFWGIRRIRNLPFDGSALLVMDSGPLRPGAGGGMIGTPPPPIENQANRVGVDPHGLGGDTAEIRPPGGRVPATGWRAAARLRRRTVPHRRLDRALADQRGSTSSRPFSPTASERCPRSRSRRSSPTSSRRQPWSVRVSGSGPPLRT